METPPNEQSQEESTSGGGAIDQAAADALLGNAANDEQAAGKARPDPDAASATETAQEVSQDDIDALLQAPGEGAPDAAGPSEATSGESPAEDRVDTPGRPLDGAAAVQTDDASAPTQGDASGVPTKPFELPELSAPKEPDVDAKRVTMLNDVNLRVKIELGRTRMLVEDVLKLDNGSVVELDKLAGDPVDVYVNDRLVARGEVLVLNDSFCVRVSEVLSHDPHRITG